MNLLERGLYVIGGVGLVVVLAWIGLTRELSAWNSVAGVLSCSAVAAGWIMHAAFARSASTDHSAAGEVIEQHGVRASGSVTGKSGWHRSRDRISQRRIRSGGNVIGKQEHPPEGRL